MAYCSQADVQIASGGEAKLIQLTDDAGAGVVGTATLTQMIADADGWIDGYLRKRYAVPLTTVPSDIRALSAAETVYLLRSRPPHSITDRDQERHEERLEKLRDIAKGLCGIAVDVLPSRSSSVVPEILERDEDEAISRASLDDNW